MFDLPKNNSNVIKVVGVGGGGGNAVNHMFLQGIKGVDFVVCNTDAQALQNSPIPNKIQLGVSLTEGLGAGANPEIGEQAAMESYEEIKSMLKTHSKMVFITVGMGGGTGTGAAPIIAKIAKDLDLLTIGIVTIPFSFEGKMRNDQAQKGIEKIRQHVDSLIIINNNKLREVYGNLGFKSGFSKADEVLSTAARGIAEVITHHYTQNIDLKDAKTVLSNSGSAIMGSAIASGDNRAQECISKALDSPLLNDNKIIGAKNVLLLIVSGSEEITIDEIGEINDYIQTESKNNVNIIMGVGEDENLNDAISVTVIATGFNKEQQYQISNAKEKKIIHTLEGEQEVTYNFSESDKLTSEVNESGDKDDVNDDTERKVFNLEDDEIEEKVEITPNALKINDIEVEYEEISKELIDDFVITSVSKIEEEMENEIEETIDEKEQTTFTFDLPLNKSNEKYSIENELEAVNNIKVVGLEEVKPEKDENEVRYSLEDYTKLEDSLLKAKKEVEITDEDEELNFKVKTKPDQPLSLEDDEEVKEVSPLYLTISELQERADDRKKKMKEFNYKFINKLNKNIEEIEREPAYKRMGVELDESTPSSENTQSRLSLGTDDNDDIQLRSNNSFLHDNVD